MHLTQSYIIPRSLYVRAFIVLLIKSFHKPFQLQTEFNILLVSLREDFHKKTTTNMYLSSPGPKPLVSKPKPKGHGLTLKSHGPTLRHIERNHIG